MAEPKIGVTTEDVRDLASSCVKTGKEVAERLNSLEGRVQNVVESSWVGSASSSFDSFFKEFNQGQKKIEQALDDVSKRLRGAADTYDQNEHDIAARFRGQ